MSHNVILNDILSLQSHQAKKLWFRLIYQILPFDLYFSLIGCEQKKLFLFYLLETPAAACIKKKTQDGHKKYQGSSLKSIKERNQNSVQGFLLFKLGLTKWPTIRSWGEWLQNSWQIFIIRIQSWLIFTD